jgi:hypothetical protein
VRRIPIPIRVVAACAGLLLAGPAHAIEGGEWRRLPAAARSAYVMGIVDAWSGLVDVQTALGKNESGITVFADVVSCVRDRLLPDAQIVAIVERYVADNPGRSSTEMRDLVFAALSQECRK